MKEVYQSAFKQMNTSQAVLIIFCVIAIGVILLKGMLLVAELITHKKIAPSALFFNFKQKIWMTIGLGTIFFSLYLILLFLGAFKLSAEDRLNLFFKAYQNPITYAYRGLFFFVALSLFIYVVRVAIIFLYNSKKR